MEEVARLAFEFVIEPLARDGLVPLGALMIHQRAFDEIEVRLDCRACAFGVSRDQRIVDCAMLVQ